MRIHLVGSASMFGVAVDVDVGGDATDVSWSPFGRVLSSAPPLISPASGRLALDDAWMVCNCCCVTTDELVVGIKLTTFRTVMFRFKMLDLRTWWLCRPVDGLNTIVPFGASRCCTVAVLNAILPLVDGDVPLLTIFSVDKSILVPGANLVKVPGPANEAVADCPVVASFSGGIDLSVWRSCSSRYCAEVSFSGGIDLRSVLLSVSNRSSRLPRLFNRSPLKMSLSVTGLGDDGFVCFKTLAALITTGRFGSFPSGEVIKMLVVVGVEVDSGDSMWTLAPAVGDDVIALWSCKLPSLSANNIGKSKMSDKSVADVVMVESIELAVVCTLPGLMICWLLIMIFLSFGVDGCNDIASPTAGWARTV